MYLGHVLLWPDTSKPGVHMRRLDDVDCFSEADATLIAEAGTVFHECGLSPRELLVLVKDAISIQANNAGDGIGTHIALSDWAKNARAALAKHKDV